jgi:hypothetical protein
LTRTYNNIEYSWNMRNPISCRRDDVNIGRFGTTALLALNFERLVVRHIRSATVYNFANGIATITLQLPDVDAKTAQTPGGI